MRRALRSFFAARPFTTSQPRRRLSAAASDLSQG